MIVRHSGEPTLWQVHRVGSFFAKASVGLLQLCWLSYPGVAERCAFADRHLHYQQRELSSERPLLPFSYETPDSRFRLHYALLGRDAVPSGDYDRNGLPDYLDTATALLQYVYTVLVDSLQYPPPPSDSGRGGSSAYDVYFVDLGGRGLYGETVPEQLLPRGVYPCFSSFLLLDNDYSPLDSSNQRPTYRETGVRALRIAIAHELYHAIQFGNYGIAQHGVLLYELASTFMEWRVFPDTRDYEQFLPELFHSPERCVFGEADNVSLGYRFAVFGQYLYLRWGDGVLRRMWEGIGRGAHPYAALDTALQQVGGITLADAWCQFLPWMYYTGERARPGYFPRAADFPTVRFAVAERFVAPAFVHTGHLLPFEFRFARVLVGHESGSRTPDTLDVAFSYPNTSAVVSRHSSAVTYTLAFGMLPQGDPLPGTPYKIQWESNHTLCHHTFWNAGFPLQVISGPYPQPYLVGRHEKLCLPVPASVRLEESAEVELYTPAWTRVARFAARVQADGEWMTCCIVPGSLQSGVYVYRLHVAGYEEWGKLVVRAEP